MILSMNIRGIDMIDWVSVRNALISGKPVLVFDSSSREAETDMVFYAGSIDYKKIHMLRKEAGGLICYVSGRIFREALGLEYLNEVFRNHPSYKHLVSKRPRYGDPPAFNIWVNHVNTRTGINDFDKATTIQRLHYVAELVYKGFIEDARDTFYREFYAPGHVPILTSRGLGSRKGHTELVTALGLLTGLTPSFVIAEMLSEGTSLDRNSALKYARRNNYIYIDGFDIIVEAEKRGYLND